MKVSIASPLRSCTGGHSEVDIEGETLAALLRALDQRFPGIRSRMIDEQGRIRQHMNVFVNGEAVRTLDTPLAPGDQVHILQALSGG
jgi:MoaD family protein